LLLFLALLDAIFQSSDILTIYGYYRMYCQTR
jgi:hypothetical protein